MSFQAKYQPRMSNHVHIITYHLYFNTSYYSVLIPHKEFNNCFIHKYDKERVD